MSKATSVSELAQVLFASALQQADEPTPEQVRAVVFSSPPCDVAECAACVAQEAGDHPDEYQARMQWALEAVTAAFPDLKVVAA